MDRYERIKVLGHGSFGKVYLMRQRQERRLVCVKVIKLKGIPSQDVKREVELLRRLHHPNIVSYKDSFLTPRKEHLCIVMEYCDGGDLATQIKNARRQLFSESKILHWFVQMALGLHYMHRLRVLHRDLKTQNIFLLGNGRVVLGDLGISKVLDGTMDFARTCIGTPYYMSPEIFKNKPYNHKSDVWALGCVLYEMTTLNHAFDASSLNGLASKIIKGRYPAVHSNYSQNLRNLISSMLSTSPSTRPDLEQILTMGFVKKHIQNFFADIASRESSKIGEGTMVLKAAAVSMVQAAPAAAAGMEANPDMLALKEQLEDLSLHNVVARALATRGAPQPTNPAAAAKVVREQASALRREEERKKAVEAALGRLRAEREERLRHRQMVIEGAKYRAAPGRNRAAEGFAVANQAAQQKVGGSPAVRGGQPGAQGRDQGRKSPGLRQRKEEYYGQIQGAGQQGVRANRAGLANGLAPDRADLQVPERAEPRGQPSRGVRDRPVRRSFGGEVGWAPVPARDVAPRRVPRAVRASAGAGVEEEKDVRRVRDLDRFEKARAAERLAADAVRKREEAVAREARRKELVLEKEREQQLAEHQKLREDKLELDAKMRARERARERRRELEQRGQAADAKPVSERELVERLPAHRSSADGGGVAAPTGRARASVGAQPSGGPWGGARGPGADINTPQEPFARLRQRRDSGVQPEGAGVQAPQAALLPPPPQRSPDELRMDLTPPPAGRQGPVEGQGRPAIADRGAGVVPERMPGRHVGGEGGNGGQQGSQGEGKPEPHGHEAPMSAVELAARLDSAVESEPRFSSGAAGNPSGGSPASSAGTGCGKQSARDHGQDRAGNGLLSAETSDSDESEWPEAGIGNDGEDAGDEAIHNREEELQAELQAATMRCEELRQTLQATKSIIQATPGPPGHITGGSRVTGTERKAAQADARAPGRSTEEAGQEYLPEEQDEDEIGSVSEDGSYAEESLDSPGTRARRCSEHSLLVSEAKAVDAAQEHAAGSGDSSGSYSNGWSRRPVGRGAQGRGASASPPPAPLPTGRLADRIQFLRQRCTEGLGETVFLTAYHYVKDRESLGAAQGAMYAEDAEERLMTDLNAILGPDKVHFYNLIDQLIFIENTHFGDQG